MICLPKKRGESSVWDCTASTSTVETGAREIRLQRGNWIQTWNYNSTGTSPISGARARLRQHHQSSPRSARAKISTEREDHFSVICGKQTAENFLAAQNAFPATDSQKRPIHLQLKMSAKRTLGFFFFFFLSIGYSVKEKHSLSI